MNADVSNSDETIWACLHGELSDEGRTILEAERARDPDLNRRFEEARRLDRLLRSALPAVEPAPLSVDTLAEEALAAWERENAADVSDAPVVREPPSRKPNPAVAVSGRAFFSRRPTWGLAGLAAAAALAVMVSPVLWSPRSASWSKPVFAPLALRGHPSAGGAALPSDTADRCQKALVVTLARALEARGVRLPQSLTLSFRLQELSNGAFSVTVQARRRDGRAVGEWSGDYSGVASFLSLAEASAARIADALAVEFRGSSGGGRP